MAQAKMQPGPMAFFAGLTLGGILAMLYAPKSGEETRADLKYRMNVAKDRAHQAANTFAGKSENAMENAKENIDTAIENAKDKTRKAAAFNRRMERNAKDDEMAEIGDKPVM